MDNEDSKYDFSFDSSGQFMLAQVYLLGAALQIDRYEEAIRQHEHSKVAGLFMQLHDASCLLEDLACLTEYYIQGNFHHSSHKLWKQARHHIRHDMRDLMTGEVAIGQTKKRHKYLKLKPGLKSQITFKEDRFTLGGVDIAIDDIKNIS